MAVGGAPKAVLRTLRQLDPGCSVDLVSGLPEPGEGSLIERASLLGFEPLIVPTLCREINLLNDVRAFFSLYRLISRGRYHVVHTHLSKAGILGRLAAWFCGVGRIVHTYHGDVFTGYFGSVKSSVLLTVERLVSSVTHVVVAVTEPLALRCIDRRLASPGRIRVIRHDLDVERFAPRSSKTHRAGVRVGSVAMLMPIKRLDLLVTAARRMRGRPLTFEVAGDGPDAARLKSMSRDLEFFRWLGIRDDVDEFLRSLDVFVACSDYEGAGLALMEAMATGLAVVSTDVGGVPEIIENEVTGLLVAPDDAGALAHAIERLVDDQDLRKRLGQAARERMLRGFPEDSPGRSYARLYRETISVP
jgi:glycosyltransferase involved in cell wall biosynthesis